MYIKGGMLYNTMKKITGQDNYFLYKRLLFFV